MAKKIFVSMSDMGPQLAQAVETAKKDTGSETAQAHAAEALDVELLELARARPLSLTWHVKVKPALGAAEVPVASTTQLALVMVADEATPAERELFGRMAEEVRAAGDALPGILPVRALTPSRDAFLTDLWTAGSARNLSALKWSARQRVSFVLTVVRTIDSLHALGMVHGCLCEGNVLLDDALEPVVAESGSVPVHELAARGGEAATPYKACAAPEVLRGDEADVRSDVFSLGRLLADAVKEDEPNAALGAIVARCTAADATARYASAGELATALEAIVGQLSASDAQAPAAAPVLAPRPPAPRERAAAAEPMAARGAPSTPQTAWQPPRSLGLGGLVLVVLAVGMSALVGGSSDALRAALQVAFVVGVALVTTLLRIPRTETLKRGLAMQLGLGVGAAALVVVLDPLAIPYRMAAQRHLHGDEASRHAAVGELVRLGRDFRGLSLATVDLTDTDLTGADLRGVDLSHANLTHARLFGAEVQGASLDGATLNGADLEQVELALATLGAATCTDETRLPHGWRCRDARLARSP